MSGEVVLLHGFLGDRQDWREVCARLDGIASRAIDFPGFGTSIAAEGSWDIESVADRLVEALPPATLVGYSMGGRVALATAIRHPQQVRGLVLVSASAGLSDPRERKERRVLDHRRAARLRQDPHSFLEAWYQAPLFASLVASDAFARLLQRRRIALDKPGAAQAAARALLEMGTGVQPSYWSRLSELACPTLVITGGLDTKFVRLARRMVACNPAIQHLSIANVGHAIPMEAPAALARAIHRFVRQANEDVAHGRST